MVTLSAMPGAEWRGGILVEPKMDLLERFPEELD
jgi:hypothetical protein